MRSSITMLGLALMLAACSSGGDDAPAGPGGGDHDGGGVTETDGGTTPDPDGGTTPDPDGGGPHAPNALFQAPEPWTKDVSKLPPSDRSGAIIGALQSAGGWGNGNTLQIDFAIPLFFADTATPRVTVGPGDDYCFGASSPDCETVPIQVPLPAGSHIEGSSDLTCPVDDEDCHVLVAELSEKKLYELYKATSDGAGLSAKGVFIWDLAKAYPDNGRGEQCTSADAAGLPIAGLLPTADEVKAGAVNHALRFILPNARMKKDVYVHPASHAGGPSSSDANAPPYGVRFRLKATFDESPFNAGEKVILHALKTYGMILSDGGNIALTFADDRTSKAKWSDVGITSKSFNDIGVDQFEVVDLGPEIPLTFDCVRNP